MERLRVVLADDQTLVRQGIARLLSLADDLDVVAEAGDGEEALALARRERPDLLLLDVRMPRLSGLDVLRTLRAEGNEVPVVLLTTFSDSRDALMGLRLGAHSYLLKDVDLELLLSTMRSAAQGEKTIHSAVPRHLLSAPDPAAPDHEHAAPDLTAREQEVLKMMAGGHSNKQIALALSLQEGTVKNHVSSILLKLGVRDRVQAILQALTLGLL